MQARIRAYRDSDLPAIAELWRRCGLLRHEADPETHIAQCRDSGRGAVFVAERESESIGTVMVGHDGVQGWLYYVAVDPAERRRNLGRRLVGRAEAWLRRHELRRVCLLVRDGEASAVSFYLRLGYSVEPRYPNSARLEGGMLLTRMLEEA